MRSIFVFIAVLFMFFLGVLLIFRAATDTSPKKAAPVVTPLPDYFDSKAVASLTIDGVVNGDDVHQATRISIGRDQRSFLVIQGYSGKVIKNYSTYNTPSAYRVFLRSIYLQGFTASRKGDSDPTGYCPDGYRYIFKLSNLAKNIYDTWSTNCDNKSGTFNGNAGEIIQLFQRQITNYNDLTADVRL